MPRMGCSVAACGGVKGTAEAVSIIRRSVSPCCLRYVFHLSRKNPEDFWRIGSSASSWHIVSDTDFLRLRLWIFQSSASIIRPVVNSEIFIVKKFRQGRHDVANIWRCTALGRISRSAYRDSKVSRTMRVGKWKRRDRPLGARRRSTSPQPTVCLPSRLIRCIDLEVQNSCEHGVDFDKANELLDGASSAAATARLNGQEGFSMHHFVSKT